MESIFINILIILLASVAMEGVAWLSHKYLMHGLFWYLHKLHHKKESSGFFEHNDFFFLIFAIPGIICLYFGMENGYNALFWIGLGITMYGMAYFLLHDIFIHQRFKFLRNTDKDRKSTRMNSSHVTISYDVICMKTKTKPV